jgi:hypothetical protein
MNRVSDPGAELETSFLGSGYENSSCHRDDIGCSRINHSHGMRERFNGAEHAAPGVDDRCERDQSASLQRLGHLFV